MRGPFSPEPREPRTAPENFRALKALEGRRAWPRIVAALAWGGVMLALPIAAGALWIAVGPADPVARYVGASVIALVVAAAIKWFDGRRSWQTPLTAQLERLEQPNWRRGADILLAGPDLPRAIDALRRDRLVVHGGILLPETSRPDGAPELDRKLSVYEPQFRASDGDLTERICTPLRAAGVRARVAGEDLGVAP